MKILKRDGTYENLNMDKINQRLRLLSTDLSFGKKLTIDTDIVSIAVAKNINDGCSSRALDEEAARIAITITDDIDFHTLAARIVISDLHKSSKDKFSEVMEDLYNNVDAKTGEKAPVISDEGIEFIRKYKNDLDNYIDYSRDYYFDYFGFKTLEKSYLMKINNQVVERPQHMYMRVAVAIHLRDENLKNLFKTYDLISKHYYTHASPTLFNALTRLNNYASCFLMGTEDSVEGIFKTFTDCAKISKVGGGIGVHISNIRAKGSVIRKTNGVSDGIIPMIQVYNKVALYINQSGKRKGSFALYVEPWHADILEFLDLKKNQGHDDLRARDLFYALWTPDLFMEYVENDKDWYLMCPDECPGLSDVYGEEFEKLYLSYVEKKLYKKVIKARNIWSKIIDSQIETGVPYISYKDSVNKKCNQKNLGTIKSSNLCNEINLYSDDKNYAVCFTEDTMVLTKNGYKQIVDCDEEYVYSHYADDKSFIESKSYNKCKLIDNGEKQVYKVKFDNGNVIKSTLNHPFLTKNNGRYKWKQLEELSIYDNVVSIELGDEKYVKLETLEYYGLAKVYDLTVQDTHNFIVEKMVVHNCNLASIALPKYVEYDDNGKPYFNFIKLKDVAEYIVTPMNNIIDNTFYPTSETHKTNDENRPLGIGIQGLADVYFKMKLPYESKEAELLNIEIFETIYYGTLKGSLELSKVYGPYKTFKGSPYSFGKLQFDLAKEYDNIDLNKYISGRWDWKSLKDDIKKYGTRNSMMTALMPTASTSQIMGNTESFEYDSNIYKRRVLSGEFIVMNKYLIKDLKDLGIWNSDIKNAIILNNGSIQNIKIIPSNIKEIYKTIWEIKMKPFINQARDRQIFVDQSCSMNLFCENPSTTIISSMLMYGWKQKLKTGVYYLRSKSKATAAKFSLDAEFEKNKGTIECDEEVCVMCSS